MDEQPVVAILAGGAATRMGRDKARVVLGDKALIDHVRDAATAAGLPVLVVGPDGIPDLRPPHSGPLAGIEAALIQTGGPVVAVAVDQPWVLPQTIGGLASMQGDAAVPRDGRLQVTCALYRPACLTTIKHVLDEGPASVTRALDEMGVVEVEPTSWQAWGEDGRSWFSVDAPQDLTVGTERFGLPGTGTMKP